MSTPPLPHQFQPQQSSGGSGILKGCLIGCAIVGGLVVIGLVALFALGAHVMQGPGEVDVSVSVPAEARVGEEIELVVEIANTRKDEAFDLGDIDLAEAFLAGFTVVDTEPDPKGSTAVPFVETRSFDFGRTIPAGATERFTFRLKAAEEGNWVGDVDVYEGMQVVTNVASVRVRPAGEALPAQAAAPDGATAPADATAPVVPAESTAPDGATAP